MYCTLEDVKDLLDIDRTDYDDKLYRCIVDADNYIDAILKGFAVSTALKGTLSRLYAAYLYRSSIFETSSERSSATASNFKSAFDSMVKAIKEQHVAFKKVDGY